MRLFKTSASLEALEGLRALVSEALEGLLPAVRVERAVLAVDELVTNLIVHGYRGTAGPLEVEVDPGPDAVRVRLRDAAPCFDPASVPPPDLSLPADVRPPGGVGLHLVRCGVDELLHRALPGGGNEVTLVLRLEAGAVR